MRKRFSGAVLLAFFMIPTACRQPKSSSNANSDVGGSGQLQVDPVSEETFNSIFGYLKQGIDSDSRLAEALASSDPKVKAAAEQAIARIDGARDKVNPTQVLSAVQTLVTNPNIPTNKWAELLQAVSILMDLVSKNESKESYEEMLLKTGAQYSDFKVAVEAYAAAQTLKNEKAIATAITTMAHSDPLFVQKFPVTSALNFLMSDDAFAGDDGIKARMDLLEGVAGINLGQDSSIEQQRENHDLVLMSQSVIRGWVATAADRSEDVAFVYPFVSKMHEIVMAAGTGMAQVATVVCGRVTNSMIDGGASQAEIENELVIVHRVFDLRNEIALLMRNDRNSSELAAINRDLALLTLSVSRADTIAEITSLRDHLLGLYQDLINALATGEEASVLGHSIAEIKTLVDVSYASGTKFGDESATPAGSSASSSSTGSGSSSGTGSSSGSGSSTGTTTVVSYAVSYNGNSHSGGTVPVDSTNYSANDSVTVAANSGTLLKTGFAFSGWNTSADGSGTAYTPADTFLIGSANITLYAQWVTAYSITYDGNGNSGGSVPSDSTPYLNGTSVTVLGNSGALAKTGFNFSGWNTAANGSGTSYGAGATFNVSAANVTLYAKWTPSVSSSGNYYTANPYVPPSDAYACTGARLTATSYSYLEAAETAFGRDINQDTFINSVNAYLICNAKQWLAFSKACNGATTTTCNKHVIIGADIDFADLDDTGDDRDATADGYTTLNQTDILSGGSASTSYNGSVDGGGHAIRRVKVISSGDYVGAVYGRIWSSGKVHNIGVFDSFVKGRSIVGGIAGMAGFTKFKNVTNGATVESTETSSWAYVGGIAGDTWLGDATYVNNTGTIICGTSCDGVGGIYGHSNYSVTSYLINTGTVNPTGAKGSGYVGGIFGFMSGASSPPGSLTYAFNSGNVIGGGGIIGHMNSYTSASKVFNTGNVSISSQSDYSIGGVVRSMSGSTVLPTIADCYNTGTVSGAQFTGGIVGTVPSGSSVSRCYNIGTTTPKATFTSKGDAGSNSGTLANNYYLTGSAGTAQSATALASSAFGSAENFTNFNFTVGSGVWVMGSGKSGVANRPILNLFEE